MGWLRDNRAENSQKASADRRVGNMRSAPGGKTESRSAMMKAKPDKATEGLLKRAERGDETAKEILAQRWKRDH